MRRLQVLKSFEKKDTALKAKAATNLSFLYFLEGDIVQADKYANLAVKHDRYNAKALVNKGTCVLHVVAGVAVTTNSVAVCRLATGSR